jgi:DNA (cytosine-5)-methyltransferase 1
MKILNLYACLGGNRYKWDEVADNLEITAVEYDPELARLYQERFPNDTVIVADAHQYLLDHYKEFDFIWASPPCPTHSRSNNFLNAQGVERYPDMKLYQEIIFLDNFFKGQYCIENVIPYYKPLISAQKRGRHLYWTNFKLPNQLSKRSAPSMRARGENREDKIDNWIDFHEYDFRKYKGEQKRGKISRNLVDYEAGKTILETALGVIRKKDIKQTELF